MNQIRLNAIQERADVWITSHVRHSQTFQKKVYKIVIKTQFAENVRLNFASVIAKSYRIANRKFAQRYVHDFFAVRPIEIYDNERAVGEYSNVVRFQIDVEYTSRVHFFHDGDKTFGIISR